MTLAMMGEEVSTVSEELGGGDTGGRRRRRSHQEGLNISYQRNKNIVV